jgi:predicted oxidoreductase
MNEYLILNNNARVFVKAQYRINCAITKQMTVIDIPEKPTFSRLIYGTWRLADNNPELAKPESILQRIHACLDAGINTFDLADIYGGYTYEKLFGDALSLEPSLRDRMQIITKCGIMIECEQKPGVYVKHYDTSYEHITASVDASLRNIGTNYVDVLLIHRPDPFMDVDQVVRAFVSLRESGKVRHFGVSNFTPSQFEMLKSRLDKVRIPLVTM